MTIDDGTVEGDLDGVTAAPDHHRVLFENDRVRVIESNIPAGDITPVHTHLRDRVMYVISGSHFSRRDVAGITIEDTRAADPLVELPRVMWGGPMPAHTIENTGADDLMVIAIELKT